MKAIFLRALEKTEDKDRVLREAIASPGPAMGRTRFDVEPATFREIARSPFSYWVTDQVRSIFSSLPLFEAEGRAARRGPSTCDDFRYLRCAWEVPSEKKHAFGEWIPFAKGGVFGRYYADIYLAVDWEPRRMTFLGFFGRPGRWITRPESVDDFFRPGLTWPLRTNGLSFRALPKGCIFGHKGPAALVGGDRAEELLGLSAVVNSAPFGFLVSLQLARTELAQSYEVGLIQQTPVLAPTPEQQAGLATIARRSWSLKRALDTRTENSHAFYLPALLQMDGGLLSDRADAWSQRVADTDAELARLQAEIDDRCFELYGIDGADREQIERGLGGSSAQDDVADTEDDEDETANSEGLAASLLSWSVGVAFGRFDLRLATGERPAPPEPEPFDPLSVCSPGMLTGEDGLPLDAPPAGYAVDFPRDGILTDDAGTPRDLVASARRVFEHVFDDPAARWDEAAEILGQRDRTLRRWFARDFFGLHLKQYSKSRRKAPIYWPLSTASGSYTVWLYYPRLAADTLFQVVAEHLEPKLRKTQEERLQVDAAQGRAEGREAAKLAEQAGELAELEQELEEMKAELLRVAELPYKPNLNDGMQITAAPLAKLFQLKAWRKVLETTWKRLEKGEYDWAHLAHAIWPDRVRDKCRADRSLAIAHDLEDLCEVEVAG